MWRICSDARRTSAQQEKKRVLAPLALRCVTTKQGDLQAFCFDAAWLKSASPALAAHGLPSGSPEGATRKTLMSCTMSGRPAEAATVSTQAS